jgi:hypothetical protein
VTSDGRVGAIKRTRPWERGRIGNIERRIGFAGAVLGPEDKREFTTGDLARAIYGHPDWDQNIRIRAEGAPPPKLKSWHYLAIRKAAPTFADRIGRSTTRGRPWLWRVRSELWFEVRRRKEERDKQRRAR